MKPPNVFVSAIPLNGCIHQKSLPPSIVARARPRLLVSYYDNEKHTAPASFYPALGPPSKSFLLRKLPKTSLKAGLESEDMNAPRVTFPSEKSTHPESLLDIRINDGVIIKRCRHCGTEQKARHKAYESESEFLPRTFQTFAICILQRHRTRMARLPLLSPTRKQLDSLEIGLFNAQVFKNNTDFIHPDSQVNTTGGANATASSDPIEKTRFGSVNPGSILLIIVGLSVGLVVLYKIIQFFKAKRQQRLRKKDTLPPIIFKPPEPARLHSRIYRPRKIELKPLHTSFSKRQYQGKGVWKAVEVSLNLPLSRLLKKQLTLEHFRSSKE
ncbi:hypothetical protein O181_003294 [Austropuccinia psidii MF-1]|uniref:Uncharacterized protein n=1 Tax=Austropuccinia psidii MF-1 TaxID=1389203 RepID=A0A9Q3BE47_9BASI|nr:hypothetical protein [Austropuccinia psidii MF-1]